MLIPLPMLTFIMLALASAIAASVLTKLYSRLAESPKLMDVELLVHYKFN